MASYLRSLFGGSSSSRSSTERSKSHSRSHSVPAPINTNMPYVYNGQYAAPASAAPAYSSTRSHSPTTSRATRPSPLRYNTYDSSTISSKTRPTRPLPSGSISYKAGDSFLPYPLYTPAATSTYSSRTNSNSSMAPPSTASGYTPSHRPSAPRTSSSTSVVSRPALKQTHTWHGHGGSKPDGPRPHVSFVNPNRPQTLHMHPLLAASSHSRAPISYDVMFPPTPKTVVDRTTRTAVPSHTLSQPATDPPTCHTLVLRSDKFPWPIVVQPAYGASVIDSHSHSARNPKSAAKFYLGDCNHSASSHSSHHCQSNSREIPITNNDLIFALHRTLSARVTREEWDALGKGSRAQRKVTRAYERRTRTLGDKEGGVRRIDWLGEKTRLIGIEVDKTASDMGVAKLVFGKP
ncbi:hypothetical protein K435DRAFT_650841 [Dendrothele bispora CBS 962.96]|uniref:DUF6699 domain-containing protein n=1 Tax=Dendrothele bispora (strain CBS 962.96) TaxID=1314807 RepID=A0A4S8MAR1_DENBC|nr:hypothetical protein K435DRAFT_490470 [Dendrothele bispora CBS 962.96]THV03723.1 hypothetical protein K435DRAFT_650841 [Dendrothele bispora CBS 962.96]